MTTEPFEPGIQIILASTGERVGYLVDGYTRSWGTIKAARSARRRLRA